MQVPCAPKRAVDHSRPGSRLGHRHASLLLQHVLRLADWLGYYGEPAGEGAVPVWLEEGGNF